MATGYSISPNVFAHDRFTVRRKVMTLFSPKFHFFDEQRNIIGFVKQKALTLKDDIRIYADESMGRELVIIKARTIIDFSSAFDVVDVPTQQKVGTLKRRGWKSMFKDEWIIMNDMDAEIGRIREDSALRATLRRIHWTIRMVLPQSYLFEIREKSAGIVRQSYSPFVLKLSADFSEDINKSLDRRLAAAAVVLLIAVEGRKN